MTKINEDLKQKDEEMLNDAVKLRERVQELPEELQQFIQLLKNLEETYGELSKPSLGDERLDEAVSQVKDTLREIEDIEDTLESTLETTKDLKEDFNAELDILNKERNS